MPDQDQTSELGKRVGAQLWGSPAGKSRIAGRLLPLFPPHKTYVEPFAGGAALFWAKGASETEALNDSDVSIAGALKFVRDLSDKDVARLKRLNWKVSAAHHKALQRRQPTNAVEAFHRTTMLRYAGFMRNPDGGMDKGKIGATLNLFSRLGKAKERLKGVKIFSGDYRVVMAKFDSPDAFFFLDPPYTKTDQAVGERGFNHREFWNFLSKLKGKFMVTYDAPDPDRKFKLQILEHKVTDGKGGSNRVYRTHVITNYKAKQIQKDAALEAPGDAAGTATAQRKLYIPALVLAGEDMLISDASGMLRLSAERVDVEEIESAAKQTVVQSLILSKDKFKSPDAAKKWVKDHNFKVAHEGKGPDETETSFRFRQRDPGDFERMRTIHVTDGVQAVVGPLKKKEKAEDELPEWVERSTCQLTAIDKKAPDDRQIAFGEVLIPDDVDAHKDTIRPDEIERAAHLWLARHQNRGVMHSKIANSKIEIYESYIAPQTLTIGGKQVKKGTWLLMLHVLDDALWQKIKKGEFTGLSMGGFARRRKL